jgi:bifunctional non-homologous end joining protein LigD
LPLEEYAQKRNFALTPEPPPRVEAAGRNRFCVQRHNARRLHYDFRLEANGVLYSWAVPKGPSLDPADKRMAVHTEDHPVDYLDFEGVIPAHQYGAGSVMLWDIGTYELLGDHPFGDQHARGDIKFRLHGERLRGDFVLARTSRDGVRDWLLIKKRDEHVVRGWNIEELARSVASGLSQEDIGSGMSGRRWTREDGLIVDQASAMASPAKVEIEMPEGAIEAPMPGFLTPMQAVLGEPFSHDEWTFELKYDGIRALAYGQESRLRLLSRLGNSLSAQFPELESLPRMVAGHSWIIDGEIAALRPDGISDFQLLQPRIHARSALAASRLARSTPAIYYVFDLIYLNGFDLRGVPLDRRRAMLGQVLRPEGSVVFSDSVDGRGEELFALATGRGAEGIVAKRRRSLYESGRSRNWVKIKNMKTLDCVIAGYTLPKAKRSRFGALVLGLYEGRRLVSVGHAGSGFDEDTLEELGDLLEPIVQEQCPFDPCPEVDEPTRWVHPEYVCQVRYGFWTREGMLRHTTFQHLRPDKKPAECTRDQDDATRPGEPLVGAGEETESGVERRVRPPLLSAEAGPAEVVIRIEGRTLKLTRLDKVLFPRFGYTKRDVINFYERISDFVLPYLRERPLTLKRYPNGIEGEFFFQKRAVESYPDWLTTELLVTSEREEMETVVCNDRATLIFLANLACIDQNPWLSRRSSVEVPEFLLVDLDPQDCPFDRVVEAALVLKESLDGIGLQGFPKTSGARGLHVYVPLEARYSFDQTRNLAHILARLGAARRPDLFTLPRTVEKREKGKVYMDHPQNRKGSTIAAPYVLRPVPNAQVATPLDWSEVKPGLSPEMFTIATMFERLARVGDLFAPVLTLRQPLEPAIAKLEAILGGGR